MPFTKWLRCIITILPCVQFCSSWLHAGSPHLARYATGSEMREKQKKHVLHSLFTSFDANPRGPLKMLEPQNPRIDEFYAVQACRATDLKAPKL